MNWKHDSALKANIVRLVINSSFYRVALTTPRKVRTLWVVLKQYSNKYFDGFVKGKFADRDRRI